MLYPNFLGSRQIGLPGFQLVRGLPHRNTSLDYSCTASVYSTPTTRILLLTSLWWYTAKRCWRFSSSPTRITSTGKNHLIQYPESRYLITLHLGRTEKSLFTELIMFELPWSDSNRHVSDVLPIELHGKPKGKKSYERMTRQVHHAWRKLSPGFEPGTYWFVISCSSNELW